MNRTSLMAAGLLALLAVPATDVRASSPCIALTLPTLRGMEGNATDLSTALRDLIATFLTGPTLRSISLDARLPAQALEEARQKECPHLLTVTVTRRQSGGGAFSRALGQAAGAAAWQLPYSSAAGHVAARAGATAASAIASGTRERDEIRLEFRLSSDDGRTLREGRESEKARTDGEDLITPLVERMANLVVPSVTK